MPDNILIRGVNWVGDAVMTMPAINAVRKAYPGSKISLLVKPWVAPLFENYPFVDEIILYDEKYAGITGKIRLAGALRNKKFDIAFLLQNAFDAALLSFLAGIPERIGYKRDGRGFLLTKPIPYHGEDRKMHHIDYYLELLGRAGVEAEYSEPYIYLTLEERLLAREALKGLKRPVIGINPGAAYGSAKQWGEEKFAEVARGVLKKLDGSVVVFGGKTDDFGRISSVSNEPGRFLSLAGKTTLRELCGLISECDALLTNDSGPMHIGYAVKTPLVAVFGSTDPRLTGPVAKGDIVIKRDTGCPPCFERTCRTDRMKCMEEISAEEVFEAVKNRIPRGRAVFFDRDGTLCEDANFLKSWDKFKVFPDIDKLDLLKKGGFSLIGVSNQSGIARGIVDEGFAKEVNEVFVNRYGFDAFYHCPHHPEEHCSCRKPEPGMPLRARQELSVDLKSSFVVGDKEADMLLAKSVGARAVLVLTGEARETADADFTAKNLTEAVRWILENGYNK